ncbi:hypothetical protein [Sanyastnella coralliicola]|uniref:hypothetical protein n=1 Tax=Sanyastnella coralliicola TaxID=3069118 RepID=UPI0027BB01E0|nr:hypothetical protein [Longitalea sp. SCSIO 12813]
MNEHWITDGIIDAEYKQYLFLAWVQRIKQEFRNSRLYPALSQLITQHQNLNKLEADRQQMNDLLDKDLVGFDMKKMRLIYRALNSMPELDNYLEEMIQFAVPHVEKMLQEGKSIYEMVEEHMFFTPIGVMPLYRNEGYLFLYNEPKKEVFLSRFLMSRLQAANEGYHRLETELIASRPKKLSESFETIKTELIRNFRELPNPATFLIRTEFAFPLTETLLPVAKRRLVIELNKLSA